ncbi:hypothetical protein BH10CYA1_BH10CYA1_40250 [soil metagenome]
MSVKSYELTEEEEKLVLAALQRMLVRGRYSRVPGAKLIDFQRLVAKFSGKRLVRVGRKNLLLDEEEVKRRPAEEW